MSDMERFMTKVSQDCWIWTGAQQTNGYGKVGRHVNGKPIYVAAHRWSWMIHVGPIPKGQFVLHKCDVKLCVNPEHLFLGTDMDNSKDMRAKGRDRAVGERNYWAKVTEAQVLEIRARYTGKRGEQAKFSREYGIPYGIITSIVNRNTWKHLPEVPPIATTLPVTKGETK